MGGVEPWRLATYVGLSAISYYMYNEMCFLALGRVHAITHAIGNTIKRVALILASALVLSTPLSLMGLMGTAIALLSACLYSMAKARYGGPVTLSSDLRRRGKALDRLGQERSEVKLPDQADLWR